jgi:hypothetical protein
MDAEEERRDVAVAEDDLRVAPDAVEVEKRKQPAAAPAAADRQDSAHFRVREKAVDVVGAILVLTGEVAMTIEEVSTDLHLEPERFERLARDVEIHCFERGACRRDHRDRVSR